MAMIMPYSIGIARGATLATLATLATGDADGDGDVDGADFVVWQTNFPSSGSAGAAVVPEPASGWLALVALMAAGCIRGHRRI